MLKDVPAPLPGLRRAHAVGSGLLLLNFSTFAPLARRLPGHFSVRLWEGTIWLLAFCASCGFAFAPGGWPAGGALWAASVIVLVPLKRRVLAMVFAALAGEGGCSVLRN